MAGRSRGRVCVECGRFLGMGDLELYHVHAPGNVELLKCADCGHTRDKYMEYDAFLLLLDVLLLQRPAYRHCLFNRFPNPSPTSMASPPASLEDNPTLPLNTTLKQPQTGPKQTPPPMSPREFLLRAYPILLLAQACLCLALLISQHHSNTDSTNSSSSSSRSSSDGDRYLPLSLRDAPPLPLPVLLLTCALAVAAKLCVGCLLFLVLSALQMMPWRRCSAKDHLHSQKASQTPNAPKAPESPKAPKAPKVQKGPEVYQSTKAPEVVPKAQEARVQGPAPATAAGFVTQPPEAVPVSTLNLKPIRPSLGECASSAAISLVLADAPLVLAFCMIVWHYTPGIIYSLCLLSAASSFVSFSVVLSALGSPSKALVGAILSGIKTYLEITVLSVLTSRALS